MMRSIGAAGCKPLPHAHYNVGPLALKMIALWSGPRGVGPGWGRYAERPTRMRFAEIQKGKEIAHKVSVFRRITRMFRRDR